MINHAINAIKKINRSTALIIIIIIITQSKYSRRTLCLQSSAVGMELSAGQCQTMSKFSPLFIKLKTRVFSSAFYD